MTALAAPAESRGIPIEDLVELIRNNIAKDTWDSGDSSITNSNGILIIRNVPDVHRKIIAFLSEVRKSTGMLVSVETRFLRVQDNFLEELGIDYRDLRDATGPILDDFNPPMTDPPPFTTGGNQTATQAPVGAVTAGIIGSFGDNIQRDMVTRVEHLLDTDTLVNSFYNSVFSNSGGINLTYTLLDDISLEAILHAVKKSERSHELLVPKLTLFNTQRANMLISNQVAYIRDFDIEVATGFGLPDPIVDVVQDGISLDVRPIVSADRRFITLELRPTVARLVSLPPNLPFILTPITAGGGLTVRIETPVLRVERVRTTVTIPDRGVLLLGGLSDYFEIDAISKIPILGDIPIIGMLASRKVKGRQRFQLLILLRARIVILEEDEAKTF